ncbi:MAG: hypothetical protein HW421_2878 [Ignavibacteria bacterium]|nr:hypothetical protein [Ignavibacteria bacterium]
MATIENIIETQEFATLPPVAARILKLLEDENVDTREIARAIETDAPLTMKMLRIANSPLYASRTEINSITQAIMTLGLNRLTNIVLGVSIFSKFLMSSHHQAAGLMEKFWWHSSCTGMVAKALSGKIKRSFKEFEFIGGLIHDIGKLAMLQFDSDKYQDVVNLVKDEGYIDIDAEKTLFEVNHIEVGTAIAKLWKLPDELSIIISNHNIPMETPERYKGLVAAVRLSDILCEIWGADFFEGIKAVNVDDEDSWKALCEAFPNLIDMDLEVFTFELEEDFKRSTEFLNLMLQA